MPQRELRETDQRCVGHGRAYGPRSTTTSSESDGAWDPVARPRPSRPGGLTPCSTNPKLFPLEHKRDCEQFDVHEFTGYLGDLMLRCQGCGAVGVAELTRDYTHGTTETAPAVPLVTQLLLPGALQPRHTEGRRLPQVHQRKQEEGPTMTTTNKELAAAQALRPHRTPPRRPPKNATVSPRRPRHWQRLRGEAPGRREGAFEAERVKVANATMRRPKTSISRDQAWGELR